MTERMVQVPVSLIERAPHAPGCQIAGLWILPENGGRAVQQSGKCTCWKAEVDALLSQPTPAAEPPATYQQGYDDGFMAGEHHVRNTETLPVAPPTLGQRKTRREQLMKEAGR